MKNIRRKRRNTSARAKVLVGLSGGVDSAASAALLQREGYDVTGVFIRVWQPDFAPCTWREERRDAMRVALALGIPFISLDLSQEYKQGVADKMIEEYRVGRTPNPDVLCNREVKFGAFWREAEKLGADYIATGHYRSGAKDQSYFLWTLTPEDLAHTLFPVGHMDKSEVRKLAHEFKLPVSEKKDSQGICFIGEISMDEFLSHYIEAKPGKVLNTQGEEIGEHKGALYYTIGERHGFEITNKGSDDGAYYVVSKDMERNTVTVSNSQPEILAHSPSKVRLAKVNWQQEPRGEVLGQIRYRGEKVPVRLYKVPPCTSTRWNLVQEAVVEFEEPQRGLSLGQSIVFYTEAGELLGGAVMDSLI